MTLKMIHVGCGGWGASWCRDFLPQNTRDGRTLYEGGEPMETHVEANLQSVALVFGAIESSRSGQPVAVQEFLAAGTSHPCSAGPAP
ncbi:hypothetical protein ACFL6X_02705 [Candidatus Latescibacterota bacterium]